MSEVFKDYLLSFFSHKRSKNIFYRSFVITFINIIVVFLSLLFSLIIGDNISFSYSYDKAENFQKVLYDLLDENITIVNNEINIGFQYDSYHDDFSNYESLYGYMVIVDTRNKNTTYEDFILTMKNEDLTDEISYDKYNSLDETEKSNYHAVITHTGLYLDTSLNTAQYEAYLENSDKKDDYFALKERYNNAEITEDEYANELYSLYGKTYYPEDVYESDSYGGLPTMFSYYRSSLNNDLTNNDYIFIYNDAIEASFKANTKQVSYLGLYDKNKTYNLKGNKENAIKDFIVDSFDAGSEYRTVSYLVVCFVVWFALMILLIIEALIFRFVLKAINPTGTIYYIKLLNLQGSFMLVSSLISFIYTIIGSFFIYKITLVATAALLILLIVFIRTLIFFIKEKRFDDSVRDL